MSNTGTNINQKLVNKIDNISRQLERTWTEEEEYSTARENNWAEKKESLIQNEGFNWLSDRGSRVVCGVSRCLQGVKTNSNYTPLVVKFEPWIQDSWNPNKYDNQYEMRVWNKAESENDEDLFCEIVASHDNGHWIIVRECVPIFFSDPSRSLQRDYIVNRDMISDFKNKFQNRGWYEHDWKHGNVGYLPEEDRTVLIDYGSFTEMKD